MTAPATVSEAELMQRTGLTQRAALKRELTRLRIRYFSSAAACGPPPPRWTLR